MPKTSAKKWIHKSAAALRPQSLSRLRQLARRPADTSDVPEVQLTGVGASHRIRKRAITLRLDEDVVAFFRSQGAGYQTRINRVLRAAIHPSKTLREHLKDAAALLEQLAHQAK